MPLVTIRTIELGLMPSAHPLRCGWGESETHSNVPLGFFLPQESWISSAL